MLSNEKKGYGCVLLKTILVKYVAKSSEGEYFEILFLTLVKKDTNLDTFANIAILCRKILKLVYFTKFSCFEEIILKCI